MGDREKGALRITETTRSRSPNTESDKFGRRLSLERVVTAVLLIGLVALGATVVYQQEQISNLNRSLTMVRTTTLMFDYSSLPSQFIVVNYSVSTFQGTGYLLQAGGKSYEYPGFYTTFEILQISGGVSEYVPFFWNTTSGPSTSHPPYNGLCFATRTPASACPYNATALSGHVNITWVMRSSTFWVTFTFE